MNYFVIEYKLPSLNEYINACRKNPFIGASFKKIVENKISEYIILYKDRGFLKPVDEPIYFAFTWYERTMKRDADNIVSAKKYILDALQTNNIIPNDNRKYVKGFIKDEVRESDRDYVVVEIIKATDIKKENFVVPGLLIKR